MKLFNISQAFAQTPEELVGDIEAPVGVTLLNLQSGGIGIVLFLSNMIKFIIIVGGLLTLINLALAGFTYLTSGGKTDANVKVKDKILMSFVGLLLIIVAYTVAALVGYLFYGDPSYIITPNITPIGQ
jgi:hypothetical protein